MTTRLLLVLFFYCLSIHATRADRFLLATFNNAEQQLRVLRSTDTSSFDGFGDGIVYRPPPGSNLRDPSLLYHQGCYYVCHTTGDFGAADYFSIIVSENLRDWSHVADVSMSGIPGIQRTWAPEWFRDNDGTVHVLVSATADNDMSNKHIIYELHALDANDLSAWSAPVPVTGSAFGWTGNEGRRVGAYDPCVIKRGPTYFMFFFNQYTDYIELASAPSLTGPYTRVGTNNWQGIGTYKEGPCIVYLGGARWRMFFADQIYSFLSYTDSTDNWQTWSPSVPVSIPGAPGNFTVNHGTLIMPPGGLDLDQQLTKDNSNSLHLSFRTTAGDHYQVLASTNLHSWEPIDTLSATNPGDLSYPLGNAVLDKCFWRIERLVP